MSKSKTSKSSKKENAVNKAAASSPAKKAAKGAPKKAAATTSQEPAPEAPKAKQGANTAAPAAKAERTPHTDSKKAKVLDLLRRTNGATLKEIMAATDWQAHSVRGFISGNLTKKMGLAVASAKREDGERAYQLNA
jgi:hypothetical protein